MSLKGYRNASSMFGFSYGGLDCNCPEIDDAFSLDPRLGGEQDDAAEQTRAEFEAMTQGDDIDAFTMFREAGKKIRNGQITAFLARSFKTQSYAFMTKIEAEIDANMRTIWTPTETNCFMRCLNGDHERGLYYPASDLAKPNLPRGRHLRR